MKKKLKDLSPFLAKLKSSGIAFSEAPIGPQGSCFRGWARRLLDCFKLFEMLS